MDIILIVIREVMIGVREFSEELSKQFSQYEALKIVLLW